MGEEGGGLSCGAGSAGTKRPVFSVTASTGLLCRPTEVQCALLKLNFSPVLTEFVSANAVRYQDTIQRRLVKCLEIKPPGFSLQLYKQFRPVMSVSCRRYLFCFSLSSLSPYPSFHSLILSRSLPPPLSRSPYPSVQFGYTRILYFRSTCTETADSKLTDFGVSKGGQVQEDKKRLKKTKLINITDLQMNRSIEIGL